MKNKINLFTSNDMGITCPRKKKWEEIKEVIGERFYDGCNEKIVYVEGY